MHPGKAGTDAAVRQKLARLVTYLDELDQIGPITLEDYLRDSIRRHAVERLIGLVVEASFDISQMLIQGAGTLVPDTYYDTFLALPSIGFIPAAKAKDMGSVAGLRNVLIHEYEQIDDAIVHRNITRVIKLFSSFVRAVQSRLDQHSSMNESV